MILGFWAFLSSTLIPLGPEPPFATAVVKYSLIGVTLWTSIWNTLGSLTSYALGYYCKWDWVEKYLRIKKSQVEHWSYKTRKIGYLIGFFAWLPFIGDIFPLVMGFFRYSFLISALSIFLGKFTKFLILGLIIRSTPIGHFIEKISLLLNI